MATELRLFADYYQVHVFDDGSETDLGDAWNEQASADGLAVGPDSLALGTAVNIFVLVSVEILGSAPGADESGFDHVVEASLRSESGKLVVMGCTDYEPEARRFEVPPGWLRVRAARSNLDQTYKLQIDSDKTPETMERLRIQVWPAEPAAAVIVKRWKEPGT